jgi:hypothetical protein
MSPNAGVGGGGSFGVSANEYSGTQDSGAQINFGDLTDSIFNPWVAVSVFWEVGGGTLRTVDIILEFMAKFIFYNFFCQISETILTR